MEIRGERSTRRWRELWAEEEGATLVEYGLMLAFIAAVCFLAVVGLGGAVAARFDSARAGW